jgi:SagB-type dehydrogenase family enzyme
MALLSVIDPAEREEFKRADHGIRGIAEGRGSIALPRMLSDEDPAADSAARRATRRFAARPVPLATIGAWLADLASSRPEGDRKHTFGSAGSLYPVQTYIHFKPGAVAGCAAGLYYHHPRQHTLVPLAIGAEIGAQVHDRFVNQPVYASAAFSVFFVDAPQACEPIYGPLASRFCVLEAGAMGHILEVAAPRYGLRTCPIGWLDFEAIAGLFDLQPGQQLLHSLVGGLADTELSAEAPSESGWEEGEL